MIHRSVNRLDAPTAAYLAGLIDGEGTITLCAQHRGERRRLVISISNTDRSLLDFVSKVVGAGKVTSKRTYSVRHSPSFAYVITSRQALVLLSQLTCFLKTYRRRRAAMALELYATLTPRNGKYSGEVARLRLEFERRFLEIGPGPRRPEAAGSVVDT